MLRIIRTALISLTLSCLALTGAAACTGGLEFIDVRGKTGSDILLIADKPAASAPNGKSGIMGCDAHTLQRALSSGRAYTEIWLWSGGGSVVAGIAMGKMIRSIPRLATRVPSRERVRQAVFAGYSEHKADRLWRGLSKRFPSPRCASACGMVFAGGTARVADLPRTIGLHSMRTSVPVGERDEGDYQSGVQRSAEWTTHMIAMGVSPRYMEIALSVSPSCMLYLSSASMRELTLINVPNRWPRDDIGVDVMSPANKNCKNQ